MTQILLCGLVICDAGMVINVHVKIQLLTKGGILNVGFTTLTGVNATQEELWVLLGHRCLSDGILTIWYYLYHFSLSTVILAYTTEIEQETFCSLLSKHMINEKWSNSLVLFVQR